MKLDDWRKKNKLSRATLAIMFDVTERAIGNYISGARIPERHIMPVIVDKTKRQVQPNDFYNI